MRIYLSGVLPLAFAFAVADTSWCLDLLLHGAFNNSFLQSFQSLVYAHISCDGCCHYGSEGENHGIPYDCNLIIPAYPRNIRYMKNKLLVDKFQSVTVDTYPLATHSRISYAYNLTRLKYRYYTCVCVWPILYFVMGSRLQPCLEFLEVLHLVCAREFCGCWKNYKQLFICQQLNIDSTASNTD